MKEQNSKLSHPTNESLFNEINKIRTELGLSNLIFDQQLYEFVTKINSKFIPPKYINNRLVLTFLSYKELYKRNTEEKIIKKWLNNSQIRQILLFPGTHGISCIFNDEKDKKNYTSLIITTIYE